jgi:type II secretory pathway pseudopilin PulG
MQQRPISPRRQQQQGFILLIIFLMAGMVALMLFQQLPRVAFESEREKEQLLIDRGEQYIRAIQLYQVDNMNAWPQSIDDLEHHNNKRYLRRRYVDPYTGKAEWRLVHTNGSQLTDSLVQKPPTTTGSTGTGSSPSASTTGTPDTPQVNAAVFERPSDLSLPGNQSFQGTTPAPPQTFFVNGGQPGIPGVQGKNGFGVPGGGLPQGVQLPGNTQSNGGFQPQFPGQFPGQTAVSGAPQQQFPGQLLPGQQFPGQPLTGQPTNLPAGFQMGPNGQLIPIPIGGPTPIPGLPGLSTPGLPAGTPQTNPGLQAIQQILTTPRAPPTGVGAPQNNTIGGGIAGIASTHTGPSIKVYKERQKYEEWEFIYVPAQAAGGAGAVPGTAPGQTRPGQQGTAPVPPSIPSGFSPPPIPAR